MKVVIEHTKVRHFECFDVLFDKDRVIYRSLQDVLLDVARAFEPHENKVTPGVGVFTQFVLELLNDCASRTVSEIKALGRRHGDERPLKTYSATLCNLRRSGRVSVNKKGKRHKWTIVRKH